MNFHSIVHALRHFAAEQPNRLAYQYYDASPGSLTAVSYGELAELVLGVASHLKLKAERGARIAILLPNSIEFLVVFYAAQAAGMIPVPLVPLNAKRSKSKGGRIDAVLVDCRPALCVIPDDCEPVESDISVCVQVSSLLAPCEPLEWEDLVPDELALLQYTSGSTSTPRGVMVRHSNVIANLKHVVAGLHVDRETVFGGWLPLFHDMGLIGLAIFPLLLGTASHLLKPETFLRRPRRWLEVISEARVVISAAPNFAYDYCAEKVVSDPALDLSCFRLALNGSEPVRAETLTRFSEKFAANQFRYEFFRPVYGLAEATLFVTARAPGQPIRSMDVRASEGGVRTRNCVSVGRPWTDAEVLVWNDAEQRRCREDEEGDILLRGPNCCAGYFGKDALSNEATFRVRLGDSPDGEYLRTGDLGLIHDGELYVSGRRKELIILRGRNYHPDDIEIAVQSSDPAFVRLGGAAVEMWIDGQQRVVLIQEVQSRGGASIDTDRLAVTAVQVAADRLDLPLYRVVLIARGTLPKTTSGKIARQRARDMLIGGELSDLATKLSSKAEVERADAMISWWRRTAGSVDVRAMDERRCIMPHVILGFGNHGFLGMQVPLELGGAGLGVTQLMRIVREVGRCDLNLAAFLGVQNGLLLGPLLAFGSERQKADLLPDFARGRNLGAFALTEPHAGSNPRAMRSSAVRESGGFRLNGTKVWIGTAAWSTMAIFFAQTRDEDGTYLGITAFLLPTDTQGVRQGPETLTVGMRGMVQNELIVEDAWVSDVMVLGTVGQGFQVAESTVTFGRLGVAAMALASVERVTCWLTKYAESREIATGTLLENPIFARRIFRMHTLALALGSLVERLTRAIDAGVQVPLEVLSATKVVSSETAFESVDQAMQAFGGRGYDEANGLAQLWRDCRLLRIFEGATEALSSHVGHALDARGDALFGFVTMLFPDKESAFKRFRGAARELSARCRLPEKDSQHAASPVERIRQNALGEAFGYLLLEVALSSSEHPIDVVEEGSRWFGRRSQVVLDDATESLEWLSRHQESLRNASGVLQQHVHVYAPTAMNVKFAPNDDVVFPPLGDLRAQTGARHALKRADDRVITNNAGLKKGLGVAAPDNDLVTLKREVLEWLVPWIRKRVPNAPMPSLDRGFAELGIDSIDATELLDEFAELHQIQIEPTVLWRFPSLDRLSQHLAERLAKQHEASFAITEEQQCVPLESASMGTQHEMSALERLAQELGD